jgi:hypothetical protein
VDIPQEAFVALDELRAVLEPVIPQPLDLAIGIKQVNGEYQDDLALVVMLPDKLPPDEVPPEQLVPEQFAGFVTDVVQLRPTEISDQTVYDPLRGGIQISRPAFTAPDGVSLMVRTGTLGAVVRSRFDQRHQLLTCQHVLPTVDVVHQPGDLTTGHRVVGTTGASVNNSSEWLDCAVAEVAAGQGTIPHVQGVGPVRGTATVSLWEQVKKRGARTELTTGVVVSITPGSVPGTLRGMMIDTFPVGGLFCWHGDSGSVVLNMHDQVVGLLFAMNDDQRDFDGTPLRSRGLASAIGHVSDALAVDIAVAPGVTSLLPDNALGLVTTFGRVTVSGWGFDLTSQVTFGGTPSLITQFVSSAELTVTPPVMPLAGPVDVVVSNAFGEFSVSSPGSTFTF